MCSKVRSAVLQNRLGQRTKPQSCEKRHEGATSFQLLGQSAASFQLMHYRTSCLKHVTTNQSIFVASADDQSRWGLFNSRFFTIQLSFERVFIVPLSKVDPKYKNRLRLVQTAMKKFSADRNCFPTFLSHLSHSAQIAFLVSEIKLALGSRRRLFLRCDVQQPDDFRNSLRSVYQTWVRLCFLEFS